MAGTAPIPPAPASTAVPALVLTHDGEALALETAAATAAADPIREVLSSVQAWAHVEWARRFGKPREVQSGPEFRRFTADLAPRLRAIKADPAATLVEYAGRARTLGVQQGFAEVSAPIEPLLDGLTTETRRGIDAATSMARSKLALAPRMVESLPKGSFLTVNRAMAPATQAVNIVERAARTVTNAELNEGLAAVAEHVGAQLVWVAEKNACVACLALSGHVIEPGGHFDWRMTFGAKAYQPKDYNADGELVAIELERPPRHPNCRCRVTPWLGHDTAGAEAVTHDWSGAIAEAKAKGDRVAEAAAHKAAAAAKESAAYDLPTALRREAERSILNGYALPSESEGVRARAADRLLARIGDAKNSRSPSGWQVPQSVKQRAGRALKRGTFTTGPVPTGRP
jgi:hypothetical protein